MKHTSLSILMTAAALTGCTTIDQTEHCIATRYGEVVDKHGSPGLASEIGKDWTCFPLTDQNFPGGDEPEKMDVQTSDPVTLGLEVSMVYAYDPETIYQQFLEKRSQEQVEIEVLNALRSGTRDAVSAWTVATVFSPRRAYLADSIKVYVMRKLGKRAILKQVYVRKITAPQSIEQARIQAAQQDQVLDQARKKATIDSVQANATLFAARAGAEAQVLTAKADNEARKLQAQVFEQNPEILRLEIAKAQASICGHAEVCILGTEPPFTDLRKGK